MQRSKENFFHMTIIFRLHECVILIALAVIGSTSTSVGLVIVKSGVKVSWCRIKFKKKHKSEQMSGHAMLTCCSIWCISLNLWSSNLKKKANKPHGKNFERLASTLVSYVIWVRWLCSCGCWLFTTIYPIIVKETAATMT